MKISYKHIGIKNCAVNYLRFGDAFDFFSETELFQMHCRWFIVGFPNKKIYAAYRQGLLAGELLAGVPDDFV